MEYFWLGLSYAVGVLLILLLGWVFALRTKGLFRILLNSAFGAVLLLCFSLFRIIYVPLNPLNALLVGFLGAPGLILVIVFTLLL